MKKIFKEAHKMTREMVKEYGVDYQAQFGLCLSYLLEKEEEEMTKEQLETLLNEETNYKIEVELNEWEKGNNHRLYLNMSNRINRLFVDIYIDVNTGAVVVANVNKGARWAKRLVEQIKEILEENKKAIITSNTKAAKEDAEKVETKEHHKKVDMAAEYYGIDNNMSSEDFEDITGMKKFDESYF